MDVLVVGAGLAGLCAIKHCLEAGINVVAYEQTNSIGGTWVYVDETGCDQNGLEIHTSCYKGLTTNLPKEIMGFPHFRFDESSIGNQGSYIGAQEVMQFFHDYAAKFDLLAHIRMEHQVVRICPKSGGKKWEAIVCDVANKQYSTHFFDGVLVCAGHYSKPFIPDYPGRETFEGTQTHSHYFRTADKFAGEDILIIGAGPSAHDIALETAKIARRVTVSHHREKLLLPVDKIQQKPDVKEITKTGVRFTDNSHENFSTIIHCTGYLYSYPFLSSDCGIHVTDNFVQPLWKQCINIRHPTMAIIGIPFNICPSHLSDLQIRFFLAFLTKRAQYPTEEAMLVDTAAEIERKFADGRPRYRAHFLGKEEFDYSKDLSAIANIRPMLPVMTKARFESQKQMTNDFFAFRNIRFELLDDENYRIFQDV